MDKAPRTMVELRMAFAAAANTANVALTEPQDQNGNTPNPAFLQGYANGWKAAHLTAQTVMDTPHGDDLDGMMAVLELLAENKRRVMALTLANIGPYVRAGTVAALEDATTATSDAVTAVKAGTPAPPAESNPDALPHRTRPSASPRPSDGGEDLSDWSGYPRVPVANVDGITELALFLGGDVTSFTGDLLRLIAKSDPSNLAKLSAAYPREVRAFLLWRASAPVAAPVLVKLLEATSMMREGR